MMVCIERRLKKENIFVKTYQSVSTVRYYDTPTPMVGKDINSRVPFSQAENQKLMAMIESASIRPYKECFDSGNLLMR